MHCAQTILFGLLNDLILMIPSHSRMTSCALVALLMGLVCAYVFVNATYGEPLEDADRENADCVNADRMIEEHNDDAAQVSETLSSEMGVT